MKILHLMSDEPVIPTISTSTVGPAGIMHLPRIWLKLLLHAVGRLPEGYKWTTGTFDRMVLDALGIDDARIMDFVQTERPDYLHFERWVRANGKALSAGDIAALNERYREFPMGPAAASERRAELGLTDDALTSGVLLNDLDDWAALHRRLVPAEARKGRA
jgi:hypothetical protein